MIVCPHCKSHRLLGSKPPKDVVVFMSCPACHELVVLFRNKTIPVSRQIIEHGTREERLAHYASILDQFMTEGLLSPEGFAVSTESQDEAPVEDPPGDSLPRAPISKEEFDRFTKVELKCIDNATYFRRHFG